MQFYHYYKVSHCLLFSECSEHEVLDKISERSETSMFADAIEKKKKRDNKRVKKAVLIV